MQIGHVFYKDGDKYVAQYTVPEIENLLRTASQARQATFSFILLSELHNCNFTASQQGRSKDAPYIVSTIDAVHFYLSGTYNDINVCILIRIYLLIVFYFYMQYRNSTYNKINLYIV